MIISHVIFSIWRQLQIWYNMFIAMPLMIQHTYRYKRNRTELKTIQRRRSSEVCVHIAYFSKFSRCLYTIATMIPQPPLLIWTDCSCPCTHFWHTCFRFNETQSAHVGNLAMECISARAYFWHLQFVMVLSILWSTLEGQCYSHSLHCQWASGGQR